MLKFGKTFIQVSCFPHFWDTVKVLLSLMPQQEIHLYLGHISKPHGLAMTPCILTSSTHTQKDTNHENRGGKKNNPVANYPEHYQVKRLTCLQFSFLLFHTNNPCSSTCNSKHTQKASLHMIFQKSKLLSGHAKLETPYTAMIRSSHI